MLSEGVQGQNQFPGVYGNRDTGTKYSLVRGMKGKLQTVLVKTTNFARHI